LSALSIKAMAQPCHSMPYPRRSFQLLIVQEYDALPGLGQACGHNLIAIASIGAALAVKAWLKEHDLRTGIVKLFGTPVNPHPSQSPVINMVG